jgi:hypothetical protein
LHYRIPVGSTIRASWITSDGLTAVFGGLAPAEDSRTTTPGHNGSAEPPPLTSSVDAIVSNSASAAVRSSTIAGDDLRRGKVVQVFQRVVLEPGDVEVGLVARRQLALGERLPSL